MTVALTTRLDSLSPPRRNHFFYGKLLDEHHLRMEQDYFNAKRWMLNRLALGYGVLCGLNVTADGSSLCVSAGVAIDGYGREIVVPRDVCIDPWRTAGDCGIKTELDRTVDHAVYLAICYRQCGTDCVPVQVSDCRPDAQSAPSTIVESFCLAVQEGDPPDFPGHDDELCGALEQGGTADEIRRRLCGVLETRSCRTAGASECVTLATVSLKADGTIGSISVCDSRPLVVGNDVLFDLLLCRNGGETPTGPTEPTEPTKPTEEPKLTHIVSTNWTHDAEFPLNSFMEGLRVEFSAKVKATTTTGRAWFAVTVEYPDTQRGIVVEQRVLEESIGIIGQDLVAMFKPDKQFQPEVASNMATFQLDRARVRAVVKCDFVSSNDSLVDGDFLGAVFPTGDRVAGGDFESWFFLKLA